MFRPAPTWLLWIVSAGSIVAAACSGAATTGGADGGGAGATTAGAGGSDGGTAGAAGAANPTDGGADVPVDVAASARAEQACRDAIIAQCERIAACTGNSADGCPATADRCPSYYFGPHTLRTVENVEACVPLLRQASCTDIVMGLGSQCLLGGLGAAGAPCSGASECASRSCSGYAPSCGTCGPALAMGAPCGNGGGSCTSGTVCHPTTRICVAAPISVAHAHEGEACDLAATPPVGCDGDLMCTPSGSGSTGGTCTALPTQGEPCLSTTGARCAAGLGCGLSTASGKRELICGDPAPCGTTTCTATAYCFESPTVQINCRPYATEGQACTRGTDDALCAPGTACVASSSADAGSERCVPVVELGAACGPDALCRDPFVCQAGHCARFDPASCFATVDAGVGQ